MTPKVLYLISYYRKSKSSSSSFTFSVLMVLGLYPKLELSIHTEKGKNLLCCLLLGVMGVPDG